MRARVSIGTLKSFRLKTDALRISINRRPFTTAARVCVRALKPGRFKRIVTLKSPHGRECRRSRTPLARAWSFEVRRGKIGNGHFLSTATRILLSVAFKRPADARKPFYPAESVNHEYETRARARPGLI